MKVIGECLIFVYVGLQLPLILAFLPSTVSYSVLALSHTCYTSFFPQNKKTLINNTNTNHTLKRKTVFFFLIFFNVTLEILFQMKKPPNFLCAKGHKREETYNASRRALTFLSNRA